MLRAEGSPFPVRTFVGVDVSVADRASALSYLCSRLLEKKKTAVAFANTNLLNNAHQLRISAELSRRFLVLNDGIGLDLLSRYLYRQRFPDNLNGTDFTADLLSAVPAGTRVFLYGAKPEVVRKAADVLARQHRIEIVGTCDGYVQGPTRDRLPFLINDARTEILLVALGNPRQEQWLLAQADKIEAPLLMAVGAFFDFVAGAVPRAPSWIRRLRLEWAFRLSLEPSRLWRRYTVDGLRLAFAAYQSRRKVRS